MGGYSRFSDDRQEGPNGSILFVPAMRFSEDFSLLPILSADYRKSRDVQEIAGGGLIVTAQHSRGISVRAVRQAGPLKLKAYTAYKEQLVKEATDEPWGEGLFDSRKMAGGVELEGKTPVLESWRAGLDYYRTRFPNYGKGQVRQLGAELGSGRNVLDFTAVDLPLAADLSLGRQRLELKLLTSLRHFPDQNIIDNGNPTSDKRRDLYAGFTAGATRPLSKAGGLESVAGLDLGYNVLSSNQGSVDVNSKIARDNFYSYGELSAGPRVHFRWRKSVTGSLSYSYARRAYADRPAQHLGGADKGEPILSHTQTFRLSLAMPVADGFSLKLSGALQHADSNMQNEGTYRYNYSSSTYLLGVAWEL